MLRRTRRAALLGVVLLSCLTACGGAGSSGAIDVPTISRSVSPTRELPTPTRSPTRTPDSPDTSAPGPSSAPTSDSTSTPTSPASSAPTESSSSPTTSPSTVPTGSGAEEEDNGSWWWLVALVLVVAVVIAWLILRRSRNRRAWGARLTSAENEIGWFARDLIPQLRGSGSPAGVSGGWTVAAPRVDALEEHLSRLITTAPGDQQRTRVLTLRDAVRTSRDRVAAVVRSGDTNLQWSLDLDEAQAPLLAVLVPPAEGSGAPRAS